MTKVTVLMAAYNAERYLAPAIECILAQRFKEFEFVIVEDGSTDGTPAILAYYAVYDDRIRVISNKENIGLTRSLNVGLAAARGDLIARMDADDLCSPERLARQVAFLEKHPDHMFVGSGYRVIDETGRVLRVYNERLDDRRARWIMQFYCPIPHSVVTFRRLDFTGVQVRYDERVRVGEDFELWLRLSRQGKVAVLTDILLDYRSHGVSIMGTVRQEVMRNCFLASVHNLRATLSPDMAGRLEAFLRISVLHEVADALTIRNAVTTMDKLVDMDRSTEPSYRRWVRKRAAGILANTIVRNGGAARNPRLLSLFIWKSRRHLPWLLIRLIENGMIAPLVQKLASIRR